MIQLAALKSKYTYTILFILLFSTGIVAVVYSEHFTAQGSMCVGFDCINEEDFGADVLRIKENNNRLRLSDETTASGTITTFLLTANDSADEGDDYFQFSYEPGDDGVDGSESLLKLKSDLDDQNEYAPAITLGHDSTEVSGSISVGSNTLLRTIKYVAEGIEDTDALINGLINHYDPTSEKKVNVSSLQAQLNTLDLAVTNLENLVSLAEQEDYDNDGQNDYIDNDDDNDGVLDVDDAYPFNDIEQFDTDNDGTGNNADTDDDNDGNLDQNDDLPLDANETLDTDNDGIGNNSDTDDDNDGVLDIDDALPLNADESVDTDNDGQGNNADVDDDNDSILDVNDAFPLDSSETIDTDGDGVGNNTDPDDDNDGVLDIDDAFTLDATESLDTDGDNIGNNSDPDDDGDGLSDIDEGIENNRDSDNDGTPDHLDLDSDNDGIPDSEDTNQVIESEGSASSTTIGRLFYLLIILPLLLARRKTLVNDKDSH